MPRPRHPSPSRHRSTAGGGPPFPDRQWSNNFQTGGGPRAPVRATDRHPAQSPASRATSKVRTSGNHNKHGPPGGGRQPSRLPFPIANQKSVLSGTPNKCGLLAAADNRLAHPSPGPQWPSTSRTSPSAAHSIADKPSTASPTNQPNATPCGIALGPPDNTANARESPLAPRLSAPGQRPPQKLEEHLLSCVINGAVPGLT